MKPEKTNLVEIRYIKDENKYFATFQVLNLSKNEIKRIMKYIKITGNQRGCKHNIKDGDFYITDFFEADLFESMYSYIIEPARQGILPERVKLETLNKEMDICMMEQDIDFSIRNVANLRKYKDLLKSVVDD